MEAILEAQGLCKHYAVSKEEKISVLKDIDLKVEKGEFVAIMGQSGSGKSTLLYNISGMDQKSSGRVYFCGKDISDLNDKEMSHLRLTRMGFVFQHSHLLKNLSIRDNIILPAYKAALKSKTEVSKDADALMMKLGIDKVGNHDITRVSGGQLQRAAICRALINQPMILFCDEPTGALNSAASIEVMNILNAVNREGTTILLVTHDVKVAARADRVIFLTDGRIEAEFIIGKYNENGSEDRKREELLLDWLTKRGF
ncbi:MAG TPA: ABC transporter ATP-binding protein [Fervidobacterium sp.]|jgi:putative ABC transport system ATP-binding protein|nr:ABC transporter ATP-binding protein [Bacteroidota bacterium]NLP07666.1 ABC transporter ATP-binding protein [Clostridiaceae bacterium]HQE49393.1 ABC transporter ATP-binding protein [Fervidobacterium sp.]HUM43169.1 ABC transporter ATP-binding protein [Fervidobacterium sp.]